MEQILRDAGDLARTGWPYAVSGTVVLAAALAWVAVASRRRPTKPETSKAGKLENRITLLVALIAAGVCAEGMWRFFGDVLKLPEPLRVVAFAVLELAAFACALRARRNVAETEDHSAGVDGIAVWGIAAMSGVFSAMDTDSTPEMVFRLVMPLLAAWLWERGMSIERRRARGMRGVNLRLTPERVLVWLRIAEPSGRTASEVDAHRRLTRVAVAARRVGARQEAGAMAWRQEWAKRRLDRALRAATAHADLAVDPVRQRALLAQIGTLNNAAALTGLRVEAPWEEMARVATPPRTWFEVQGLPVVPVTYSPPLDAEEVEPVELAITAGGVPALAAVPEYVPDEWTSDGYSAWDAVPEGAGAPWEDSPESGPSPQAEGVPDAEPDVPADVLQRAAEIFAADINAGRVPGIRPIRDALRCGQPRAQKVQAYLGVLAAQ